ncbi:PREDICTED: tRNA methyltransferase 10 homolog A-like isoform X2 [Rhagoletis zephyria]|uniref:tRNA methyltransferase 10 homolog A-like isoform X2 n=1 Tax=Rhagoletis zephyria TaxID=28612 RepID=UPI0008114794|nr:PREDICTED: tRNA methyltransferase 10 homolog A-like isoform X2 [Rhagoletis zephyria]
MPEESLEPQIKLQKIGDAKQQTENESGIETKPRGPGETPATPLSKNQLKKQKRLEKYEELKKVRRLKERERQKLKRLEAHAQGLPARVGPSRKELKKRQLQCTEQQSGHLHITGIKTDGRIHSSLKRNDGWENWHLKYHFNQTHNDVFPKEKIVYLTCESDTVLDRIEGDFVYVIGGLVDHNHHKGLCHKRATEIGLRTARLPLSEHVNMKTRAVLSTFHVFEILMRVTEGKSWTDAIMETLPVRKGAKPKVNTDSSAENQLKGNEEINSNEQILLKDQE